MSQFNHEEEHKKICFIYNNDKVVRLFKRDFPNYQCIEIKGKDEARMKSMSEQLRDTATHIFERQESCILGVGNESQPEVAVLAMLGMIKVQHKGLMVCPTCVEKLILLYEDNLQTLKDLKEALKTHAI